MADGPLTQNERRRLLAERMKAQGLNVAPVPAAPAPQAADVPLIASQPPLRGNADVAQRMGEAKALGGVDFDATRDMEAPQQAAQQAGPSVEQLLAMQGGGGGGGPRTTQTVSRTINVAPQSPEQAAQMAAYGQEAAAGAAQYETGIKTEIEAEAESHQRAAEALNRSLEEVDQVQAKVAARKEAVNARLQQFQSQVDAADKEIRNTTISEENYWKEKGSGSRVLAAIAVALGSVGASLTRTDNSALRIIEGEINRNMQAQQANLAKMERSRQNKMAQIQEGQGQIAALDNEMVKYQNLLYASAERRIQSSIEKAGTDIARAKGEQLLGQLQQSRAAANQQAMQDTLGRIDIKQVSKSGGGGGGNKLKKLQEALKTRQMWDKTFGVAKKDTGLVEFPGIIEGGIPEKDAKVFRGNLQGYKKAKRLVGQMIKLREKYGAEFVNRDAVNTGNVLRNQLALAYQQQIKGTPSDKDQEKIDAMIPDPTGIGFEMSKLKALETSIDQDMEDVLNSYQVQGARNSGLPSAQEMPEISDFKPILK